MTFLIVVVPTAGAAVVVDLWAAVSRVCVGPRKGHLEVKIVILNAARRSPDMMPGLGLLLSQDIGVQRLRGEE